ncbi:MAG: MarR family transcriptional regulator [Thermoleophilum sp.]|nr:MarR family transcriptional regulator [Thermoleophilum sp.]
MTSHRDAWHALMDAHATVVCAVERTFAAAGLPPLGWFEVLAALATAEGQMLRPRELLDHVRLSKSGLTRLVDRLEEAGLVERARCPKDRRGHHVVLTAAGRATYERMAPLYEDVLRRHLSEAISADEASDLASLLRRLATDPGKVASES